MISIRPPPLLPLSCTNSNSITDSLTIPFFSIFFPRPRICLYTILCPLSEFNSDRTYYARYVEYGEQSEASKHTMILLVRMPNRYINFKKYDYHTTATVFKWFLNFWFCWVPRGCCRFFTLFIGDGGGVGSNKTLTEIHTYIYAR